MRINTKTVWDMSGDELVVIENEGYDYDGMVMECKGGGGGSCPEPKDTPYTFRPQALTPTGGSQNQGIGQLYQQASGPPIAATNNVDANAMMQAGGPQQPQGFADGGMAMRPP